MHKSLLLALGALVLAGCAPAVGAVPSRIVNLSSGEEGRVTFDRRLLTSGSGSVTVQFSNETLSGTYNVLNSTTYTPSLRFGVGFGFSNGNYDGARTSLSAGYGPAYYDANAPRSGNFIVRGANNRTIACNFLVDNVGRGNGDCTDGQNVRYTLQF